MLLGDILNLPKSQPTVKGITVEGLGELHIKPLNLGEQIEASHARSIPDWWAKQILYSVCDKDGVRLFKDSDYWRLDHITKEAADSLLVEIFKFRDSLNSVETQKKNIEENSLLHFAMMLSRWCKRPVTEILNWSHEELTLQIAYHQISPLPQEWEETAVLWAASLTPLADTK